MQHSVTPSVAHEAIVLRTRSYGESDLIVTFFTDVNGKLTGIAKGAKNSRRRFANCLHPLSRVRVHYRVRPQRSLVFMESCDLRRPASAFAQPYKLAYAHYLLELVDRFTVEGQAAPELFSLLDLGLERVLCARASSAFLRAFELQLLSLSGYEPQWRSCKGCNTPLDRAENAWFDVDAGRAFCPHCRHRASASALEVTREALAFLEALKTMPLAQAQQSDVPPPLRASVDQLLTRLLTPHLNRPLASLQLIAQLSGLPDPGPAQDDQPERDASAPSEKQPSPDG